MTLAVSDHVPPSARRPITVRAAPRREPPFDDEAPQLRLVGPHDRALPFDEPWAGRLRDILPWQAPQATTRRDLPDPEQWARRMLIGVFEARSGKRPLQQMAAMLSPGVHAGLARDLTRAGSKRREESDFRLRSVHSSEPADGVAEIAAVIQVGGRFRAVAARLEGIDGRWRCVRLQIG